MARLVLHVADVVELAAEHLHAEQREDDDEEEEEQQQRRDGPHTVEQGRHQVTQGRPVSGKRKREEKGVIYSMLGTKNAV